MKEYTVYMHVAPNGKRYIGITCRKAENRWGKDGKGYKNNRYFWGAINKYGWDNIVHQVVTEGATEAEAKKTEKELIAFYGTHDPLHGYNFTDGGDGACGRTVSAETRAKIGAASKGNKYCAGRKITDETRNKMSASHKGAEVSAEAREKLRVANMGNQRLLGHKHTEETRAKMSASHTGLTVNDEVRARASVRMAGNQLFLGRKHTEETLAKMRDAAKRRPTGYKHTDQARANMGASHIGSKRTEETKQKMRDARNAFIKKAQAATNKGAQQ